MTPSTSARTKVFISYSHKDANFLKRLQVHLTPDVRDNRVDLWDDTKIRSGARWRIEIEQAINAARVAVLLVSADFLASEFIDKNELPPLLKAAETENLTILPVLITPCRFRTTPLADFQFVNRPLKPLIRMNRADQEETWMHVVDAIEEALNTPLPPDPTGLPPNPHSPSGKEAPPVSGELSNQQPSQGTAERYRQVLLADQSLTKLQVLSMTSPLPISSVYVRLQVHEEVSAHTSGAGRRSDMRDPLTLVTQQQRHLETRFTTALEPADAVRKYGRCIIVGDPGAGKTTLLKFLTIQTANKQLAGLPTLPVHISLNAFAQSGSADLPSFAAALWSKQYAISEEAALICIEEEVTTGNALFLLDALDEAVIGNNPVEAEATYLRVFDAITLLANRCPWVVVTARKAGYQQRRKLHAFTELDVLDFRWQEIEQYIDNWFENRSAVEQRGSADDLKIQLRNTPRLQTLAANPLLLTLITLTYERETVELPQRRAGLYERVVSILLEQWDHSRDIRRRHSFHVDNQRRLLPEIAWQMHRQGLRYFQTSKLLPIIEGFLPRIGFRSDQAATVLQDIIGDNGLLREQAEGTYGFLHLTLQEYFSSLHVHDASELLPYLGDHWWEEVTLLYAGRVFNATSLLTHLLSPNDSSNGGEDIFSTKLILAGRCLAEYTVAELEVQDQICSLLFDQLLHNKYSFTRQQFADTLAQIGRACPNKDINSKLFALLERYQRLPLGLTIARAIENYGSRDLAPVLLEFMGTLPTFSNDPYSDRGIELGRNIAEAIGRLAEPTLQPALLPRCLELITSPDVELLNAMHIAFYCLGNIGTPDTARSLLSWLDRLDLVESVRAALASVIAKFGDAATISSLLKRLADPQVGEPTAECIIDGLGRRSYRAAAPDLLTYISQDQISLFIRESCARELRFIGDEVIAQLSALVYDTHLEEEIRATCAASLTLCSLRTLQTENILESLSDLNLAESIRLEIAYALTLWGDHSLRAALPDISKKYEQENNGQVKYAIMLVLGVLGDPLFFSPMRESFIHSLIPAHLHPRIAHSLVRSLPDATLISLLRGERSIHTISLPATEWVQRRLALAQALASTDRVSLVPELLNLLEDDTLHEDVRTAIAEALGILAEQRTTLERLITIWRTYDLRDTLRRSELVQTLYRSLWMISRRIGVMVVQSGYDYRLVERSPAS